MVYVPVRHIVGTPATWVVHEPGVVDVMATIARKMHWSGMQHCILR